MSRRPKSPQPEAKKLSWFLIFPVIGVGALIGVVVAVGFRGGDASDRIALDLADAAGEMVLIPGGTFTMGRDDGPDDEKPAHEVTLAPFHLDKTEVTNAQFAAFVKETNYVTVAERKPDARRYPGLDPNKLAPGSAVFYAADASLDPRSWPQPYPPWWRWVPGACWRRPEGTGTDLSGKAKYPVVQIAWEDAAAYARWAGKRLPTEAEWEFAARGGLARKEYCWGDAHQGQDGKWYANAHQGTFPKSDTGADGFAGVSPVGSFPPNGYGLLDMSGNVWEWCADWYDPEYYAKAPRANPPGPEGGVPGPDGTAERVRRGGSFLCDDTYCRRYLPSARDRNPIDSGANHTGFRCAKNAP